MRPSRLTPIAVVLLACTTTACSGSAKSEQKADESTTEQTTSGETTEATSAEGAATTETPAEEAPPPDPYADFETMDLDSLFEVKGAVEPEQVRNFIGQKKPAITKCYQQALKDNPGLTGRMLVKITSSGDGSVAAAIVRKSTLTVKTLESCVTTTIRSWKFPQPTDGGLVMTTYAFTMPP